MSQKPLDKLERYEQESYAGHWGEDWLVTVGEGFKFYIQQCVNEGKGATIGGFEKYIDALRIEDKK